MDETTQLALFSQRRLQAYESLEQHRLNLKLIGEICPKIGVLEIITRNKIAEILGLGDDFTSKQTLGFWCHLLDKHSIHNAVADLKNINFKRYSAFNTRKKLRNYQKVKVAYSLFLNIRNRAFHFENLLKRNANGTPRLSTCPSFGGEKTLIGVDGDKIHAFLDDMLAAFDVGLGGYLGD